MVPKSPLDFIHPNQTIVQSISDLQERLPKSADYAKLARRFARTKYETNNACRSRPHTYPVGDYLCISYRYFKAPPNKAQKSRKLAARRYGPFPVTELIGEEAIRVQFPQSVRAHDVVHLEHTTPHHTQPPDIGQQSVLRAPVATIDSAAEFIVAEKLSHRRRGRSFQWLARMQIYILPEKTYLDFVSPG